MSRNIRISTVGFELAALHRGSRDFAELADAFCKSAGENLVPICRSLLTDLEAENSQSLLAAILGHSRRADAFDLLKELAAKGQQPPPRPELFASAVYSIGMLNSDQRAPYLFKLFRETPGAGDNIATKFGTGLMAAIGMCGKEGVAILREAALSHLDPEFQIDRDEGLRAFRWSYLGLVSSPEAFEDLKAIAEKDSDLRLRGMAIAALGQSPNFNNRAYLAELYARAQSPDIKRAILESLHDAANTYRDEWAASRGQMTGSMNGILKATKVPSGDEYIDYAAVWLASVTGSPESVKFVQDWIRAASTGTYDYSDLEWNSVAVRVLAVQGASLESMNTFLGDKLIRRDRVYNLCNWLLDSPAQTGGMKTAREFIDYVNTVEAMDGTFLNCLIALGRIPEAKAETESCIDRLLAREQGEWRLHVINAAQGAGGVALRPLENVIRTSSALPEVLQATSAYLKSMLQGSELPGDLRERMKSLFSPQSLESFQNGALAPHYDSPAALAVAVGLYFGRFGTPQDLSLLERLPRLLNSVALREDRLETFRRDLAEECARAADAIRLRTD